MSEYLFFTCKEQMFFACKKDFTTIPKLCFREKALLGARCDRTPCNGVATHRYYDREAARKNIAKHYSLCSECDLKHILPVFVEEGDLADTLKQMFPDYVIDW